MTLLSFDTTIDITTGDDEDSIDVTVEYSVTPFIPASRYGDAPHPAEGGEIEILSVKPYGAGKDSPDLELTDKQAQAIHDEALERSSEDLADRAADEADYRYEMLCEQRMMDDWDR